ncbi:MAG: PVC-type heme-binding CxxCH protein [Planctomycetota bacterium]
MIKRLSLSLFVLLCTLASFATLHAAEKITLQKGDHISIIGAGYADRLQHDGWIETLIQKAHPQLELVIRNIAFAGDEVVTKVRTETGATREEWLTRLKTDVVLAFFGFNESFGGDEGLPKFKTDLDAFLKEKLKANYSGKGAPRIALFSPLCQEKLPDPNMPDPTANNKNLANYTAAMAEVAKANNVLFIDLFSSTKKMYEDSKESFSFNGIHYTASGNERLAPVIFKGALNADLPSPSGELDKLRAAVIEKSETWHDRYRTVDSYNIYGQRSTIAYQSGKDGPKIRNDFIMHKEMDARDVMTANREKRVWSVANGGDAKVDDSNVPKIPKIGTNLQGTNPDGSHVFLSGEEAISKMTLAKGCKITLWASEEQFPELVKPVQMNWDTKGRLWVAAWKNYPERTPDSKDGDKLLIFEDTKGTGKADKCTTFVDDLNCPTGFQFYKDGVLVMRSPSLLFLRDTTGGDKPNFKERVLMGLDAADSHHETNSMVLDPGGATYCSDGVFHRTQVETANGPVRNTDGGIYRFEPLTNRFERYVPYGFANPHGRVFDAWGTDIITDATGNANYFAPAFSGRIDFPQKHAGMEQFWKRPSRPCPGTAYLTSRHFPEEYQNNFLNVNCIGKQGIFRVKVTDDGSGLKGETLEDLLMSSDKNFRPVGVSVGPDGALYVLDWANAIIGHLQHHLRDPNRDQIHGRIYKITFEGRPLLKPTPIHGEPIAALLNVLKEPEDNTRMRAKLELGKHPAAEVIAATKTWVAGLDKNDPNYEHHVLEALWVHQWHNVVDLDLLKRELHSPNFRVRAAAAHVLCYWRDRAPDALAWFKELANDEHPRVRLEAVRAASFFDGKDLPAAYDVAFNVLKHPMDYYLNYTYRETIKQLKSLSKTVPVPADPELAKMVEHAEKAPKPATEDSVKYGPTRKLSKPEQKVYDQGHQIYTRDSHCATCHQLNGQGLIPAIPPLTSKEWLVGNDERLIKFVLKGLMGPVNINNRHYDTSKGTPPMTGFEGLLNDNEVAAVLTYIRQSFKNDYDPIKPEAVKKVRAAIEKKAGAYEMAELMKEHPIAGWEKWADYKEPEVNPETLLAQFQGQLTGGNAEAGKKLFFESEKVQCAKCHKVNGKGADVGPELSKVAADVTKTRAHFLESLILPSKIITKGFETEMVKQNDGQVIVGIVKSDDAKFLKVMGADGKLVTIKKEDIKSRKQQKESSMPPMGEVLSKTDIANVIEYLSTLK